MIEIIKSFCILINIKENTMLSLAANRYPDEMVNPMREELTSIGVEELTSRNDVEQAVRDTRGTLLVFINSVCGCAAGGARPALKIALQHNKVPDRITTVFAGVDREAVSTAREYISSYPPSSPSLAIFKDQKLVYMMPRHQIEGRPPQEIAADIIAAFNQHCQ
jgi:putative YphP/YqiW family bacilliredoxin